MVGCAGGGGPDDCGGGRGGLGFDRVVDTVSQLFASCPIEGCQRRPKPGHLMCGGHWHAVPPHLQKAVYAAYRKYRTGGYDEADYQALRAAQAEAIEAI